MVCADAFPDPGEARTVEELVSPPAAAVDEEVNEPNPDPIAPTMTIAEPLDPELDADVKAWFDDDCRLPRLHLLGPVRAQAHGDPAAVSRRKPITSKCSLSLRSTPRASPQSRSPSILGEQGPRPR